MTPQRILTIAALLSAGPVHADKFVDKADANGDGAISLYELRAAYYADPDFNQRIEESFAEYDADGDGLISAAELSIRRAEEAVSSQADELNAPVAPRTEEAAAIPIITLAPNDGGGAASMAPDIATGARPQISEPAVDESTAPATLAPAAPKLTRSEAMIAEIDDDKSGGVSVEELSNDDEQWFSDQAFKSADGNGDGTLNAEELEQMLQSLERRGR
jgi:Ca2+-binding EF-hand superfamily protein